MHDLPRGAAGGEFLDWWKKPFPRRCWLERAYGWIEQQKPPEPVYVRVKAPPGIGSVWTLSGRNITLGEDRIAEMSEEDANCFIPAGWILLT